MRRAETYRLRRPSSITVTTSRHLSREENPRQLVVRDGLSLVLVGGSGWICMKCTESWLLLWYWTTLLGCSLGPRLSLLGRMTACVLLADIAHHCTLTGTVDQQDQPRLTATKLVPPALPATSHLPGGGSLLTGCSTQAVAVVTPAVPSNLSQSSASPPPATPEA